MPVPGSRRGHGLCRAGALLAVMGMLGGCSLQGVRELQFRQLHRIVIDSPVEQAQVGVPLTVSWRVVDPSLTDPRFAVFVDRAPVPAGEPLAWVVRDDRLCRAPCPDAAYLAQYDVYETTSTSLTLPALRDLDQPGSNEIHDLTIVLLGPDGRRAGEEAYRVQFRVPRRD